MNQSRVDFIDDRAGPVSVSPAGSTPAAADSTRRPLSLQRLVRWLLLLTVLPLLLGGATLLWHVWEGERETAERELADAARSLTIEVDQQLAVGHGQLEVLAASPLIDRGDWAAFHAYLLEVLRERPQVVVSVVDTGGRQVVHSELPFGGRPVDVWQAEENPGTADWQGLALPLGSPRFTRQVAETRRPAYSDLFYGADLQRPRVSLAIPVLRGQRLLCTLVMALPLEAIAALVDSRPARGDAAMILADGKGRVIAASRGAGVTVGQLLRMPPAAGRPADAGRLQVAASDGPDLLGSYSTSPTSGWTVLATRPRAQALSWAYAVLGMWTAIVLVVLLVAMTAASLLARRIGAPLGRLTEAARALQRRQLPELQHSGIVEVDELGEALQTAARRERRYRAHELAALHQQQEAALELAASRERAASAERLQRLMDSLFVFVSVLDLQGRVLEVNRAPLERAGIGRAEVVGRLFWDCHWWCDDPLQRARIKDAVGRAVKGELVRLDLPARMRGGERPMVDFQVTPLRDADDVVTHLVASGVDVADRVAALTASRESEERFRIMADGLPLIVWVHDARGELVFVNETYRQFFGVASEQVLGSGWKALTHPEDGSDYVDEFLACVRERRAFHGSVRVHDAQGRWRQIESWAQPRTDSHGVYQGHVGTSLDITEAREAQAEVDREAKLRQLALDAAHLGWWHYHPSQGHLVVDQRYREILGLAEAELSVESFRRLLHPDDATQLWALVERALDPRDGRPYHIEMRMPRPDGGVRWVESYGQALFEGRGPARRAVALVGTLGDITEQRATTQALRDADRRKDEFLAMLAHELRNPLGPVRNAVEILRRMGPGEPTMERARDIIDRQVHHMSRLIDDLLDVSRIAHGRIALELAPCDLGKLVRGTVENYRPALEATGLELTVQVPDEPVWVRADRTRLSQMVGNLLHNAGKFTERGGHVTVQVSPLPASAQALVSVIDDGVGMDAALLQRLFEPFTQADNSLARTQGGLGLGLALVKGLADIHGGSVRAYSDGPGHGSRFELRLPTIASPQERSPASTAALEPAAPRRVLIIEDNMDAAESLSTLLMLAGHQVKSAYDGAGGVRAAREERPDVVLCDIGLPGELDGYAVARALRADPDLAGVKLVAVSGYGQEEDRRRASEAGFDLHMVKPVDPAALLVVLAQPLPG